MSTNTTHLVTTKVRFCYAHVFEPQAIEEGQQKKYSVSIIIPKSDTALIEKVKNRIENALQAGIVKFGGKVPARYTNPLRDGDTDRPDDETYKNAYFINANSHTKPGIVDANLDELMSQDEFYSGCYGRASINFYAYNVSGNKGIAAGLNNLQKLEDGPKLSGGSSAAEDFGSFDSGDDLM